MVTGIEATGLALAIFPLIVNQVDNYARGIEKIKALRRYRWQLENCSTGLSAQYAILLNTLELSLEGVVDDHDQRSQLISNPRGPGWQDAAFRRRLARKLDRDYCAFTRTMKGLCDLLEDLSQKLGLETTDYPTAASAKPLSVLKFRRIFSAAVYEDLLEKIDKANQILKTLIEQSEHLEQSRRGSLKLKELKESLKQCRDKRRHAKALYGLMVQEGQCWGCSCQDEHSIGLQLDAIPVHSLDTTFRMIISSTKGDLSSVARQRWHEVELEANCSAGSPNIILEPEPGPQLLDVKRMVRFLMPNTKCAEQVHKSHRPLHRPSRGSPIAKLCLALNKVDATDQHAESSCLGYILDPDTAGDVSYYMTLVRNIQDELHIHSLQEALASSPSLPDSPIQSPDELSRRDRLYLATVLASSVLQLHGTWLQKQWDTQDILFIRPAECGYSQFNRPFLLHGIFSTPQKRQTRSVSKLDKGADHCQASNSILLPLALALIELSLGRTIPTLHRAEDRDPSGGVSYFNTAARLLRKVYWESGSNYGDVVKECLYWPRKKGNGPEDSQFDECMFGTIVSPLLKDFHYFEGLSSRG